MHRLLGRSARAETIRKKDALRRCGLAVAAVARRRPPERVPYGGVGRGGPPDVPAVAKVARADTALGAVLTRVASEAGHGGSVPAVQR